VCNCSPDRKLWNSDTKGRCVRMSRKALDSHDPGITTVVSRVLASHLGISGRSGSSSMEKRGRRAGHKSWATHLHTHVYCGTIHNSQVMETAKMPQH
jgi:hypothetical protein